MKRVLLSLMALLVLAGVAGCGQKGPLYLPDSETAKEHTKDRFGL